MNVIHIVPNETGAICQDVDDTFIIPEGGVTHLVVLGNVFLLNVFDVMIAESPQLTRLVLPGNQVNDLTHLIILQCKLREIPASIKELNNLIVLDITGNKIVSYFIKLFHFLLVFCSRENYQMLLVV